MLNLIQERFQLVSKIEGVSLVLSLSRTVSVSSTAATPFGEGTNTIVQIATGSTLEIPDGLVVPVQRLFRDGEGASPGDYTGAGGPASARVSPLISGTGVLRVAKGPVGFQIIFR